MRSRTQQFALFFAGLTWYWCAQTLAASAANGLGRWFDLSATRPLLEAAFLVFLTLFGFALLRAIERRRVPLRLALGIPRRKTSRAEWGTGVAIGWGVAVAAILPLALSRTLNVQLWTAPRAFELLTLNLATLALLTLSTVLAFTGYPFQRLIESIGPTRAIVLMMLLSGIGTMFFGSPAPNVSWAPVFFTMCGSLLLSLAWIRTHGLWMPWGLNFAWNASVAVLFGLPVHGSTTFASVVESRAMAPLWLGSFFGPEVSDLTPLLLLAVIPILVFATSDYAWDYTRPPLIPAGYDVTIAPPAAHVAMEEAALQAQPVNPASLVQILPASPRNSE